MSGSDITLLGSRRRRQLRLLRNITIAAYVIGLAALVLHFGFRARGQFLTAVYLAETLVLGWFVARSALLMFWSNARLSQLRDNWYDWLLILAVILTMSIAAFMDIHRKELIFGTIIEAAMTLALILRAVELTQLVAQSRFQPAQILVGSFVLLIIVGAMVLMLPASRSQIITVADENASGGTKVIRGNLYRNLGDSVVIQTGDGNIVADSSDIIEYYSAPPANWHTALFTSTSAVCVTGLVVESTGSYWSIFGQSVILVLIQLGGLGIMTFGSVFALFLFQNLNLRQSAVMTDLMSPSLSVQIGRVLVFILVSTLLLEALGAWMMWGLWNEPAMDFTQRLYFSAFHSISAFCNAGFSIYDDSLVRYADSWQTNLAFPLLMIYGGLGFFVGYNIFRIVRATARRAWAVFRRRLPPPLLDRRRLTLQSKLVLLMTVLLLVIGTGLIFMFESLPAADAAAAPDGPVASADIVNPATANEPTDDNMSRTDVGRRLLRSWFLSVTSRTAGFNTTNTALLTDSTKFLTILQMFIGGGPGATAGGIKTTTLAIVLIGVASLLTNRPSPQAFKRSISQNILLRALVIMMLGGAIVIIATITIISLQPDLKFLDALFESTSAFGTVGLSTGVTATLSTWNRIVIALVMFAGRVGPLTLFIALPLGSREVQYQYPTESVAIG